MHGFGEQGMSRVSVPLRTCMQPTACIGGAAFARQCGGNVEVHSRRTMYPYLAILNDAERARGVTISCTTKEFFTEKWHYT